MEELHLSKTSPTTWQQQTPWSRVLLEELTGFQLVRKSLHFMETEGSLSHSQQPAICHYPEPYQFNDPIPRFEYPF
jgi:hypothetical protein